MKLRTLAVLSCFSIFLAAGCGSDSTVADAGVDQCADGTDNCDVNAMCAPTMGGGFICTCSDGFNGDGVTCVDTIDCSSSPCVAGGDTAAVCTDGQTGYTCACTTGYNYDGVTCVDTDECVGNPCDDGGDTGGVCTDAMAPNVGYSCACSQGFSPNGTTCASANTAMSFFVSSTPPSQNGDGNLGGLAGADAHCRDLAMGVGAARTQWVAYLSTDGNPNITSDDVNAIDRIGTGPWFNADQVVFALDLDSLHTIETAIIACNPGPPSCLQDRADYIALKPADELFLDENGVQVTDPLQGGGRGHDIFTGSGPDGTVFSGGTCNDWTSNATSVAARVGHTDTPSATQFSPSWNSAHDTVDCSASGVASRGGAGFIYCFATD